MSLKIEVHKATEPEIAKLGCRKWPIWTCEISTFDYHYDEMETCLILEGKVTVEGDNQTVTFGPGDLVIFAKGLDCVWKVSQPVKKHYKFG